MSTILGYATDSDVLWSQDRGSFVIRGLFVPSDALGYAEGFAAGAASVPAFTAPVIASVTPSADLEPGAVGAFSASFRAARLTPITFALEGIPDGVEISVAVRYANRNETITARDAAGAWCWPFDLAETNTITAVVDGEAMLSLLPRGGWPPTDIEITIAAGAVAVLA